MTDRHALLAAILSQPGDDLARMVLADWLDETGDPRDAAHAELIRLQCSGQGEVRQRELAETYLRVSLPRDMATEVTHAGGEWWRIMSGVEVAVTRGFISGVRLSDSSDGVNLNQVPSHFVSAVTTLFATCPLDRVLFAFRESEEWWIEKLSATPGAGPLWTCGTKNSRISYKSSANRKVFGMSLARGVSSVIWRLRG